MITYLGDIEQRRMQNVAVQLFTIFREFPVRKFLGQRTERIDRHVQRQLHRLGLTSAIEGYRSYPSSCSVSINDVAIHGLPESRVLARGDHFTLDIAAVGNGYVSDTAWTYLTPGVSKRVETAYYEAWSAFREILLLVRGGTFFRELGEGAAEIAARRGFTIVPEFVGHGIGRELHEAPVVPFTPRRRAQQSPAQEGEGQLRSGMIVNIEPVFSMGGAEVEPLADGWGYRTVDGTGTFHFELSLLLDDREARILQLGGACTRELPAQPPFGTIPD